MVWISNSESLKNREVSFFAILEIVIAIFLYWGSAVYFDTYLHIFISLFLAPFFLLRSNKSISMGLFLLENGVNSKRVFSKLNRALFETLVIAHVLILTYLMLTQFYIHNNILLLFFLIICSGIGLGMGIALFGVLENQRVGILSIVSVIFVGTALEGWSTLIALLYVTLLSLILVFVLKDIGKKILGVLSAIFLGLGVGIGFLLIVFIYKLIAIISNFSQGLKNFLKNWKFNNFIIDFHYPPEIMFGIENYTGLNEYKLSNFFIKLKKVEDGIFEQFGITAVYIILYPFALFYRFSIKATFWFYIPLLILVKTPKNLNNTIDVKDFLSKLHRYIYVKFLFWMALIVLCIFLLSKLNPTFLGQWNNPFSMYMSVIYFDFSLIEVWKLLQLLLALLTIVLYFWSDFIWKKNENRGINFTQNKQIKYMFFTNNIKNVIAFLYFFFLFIYISYQFEIWNYKYIPNSLEAFLSNVMKIIQYKLF